MNRDYTYLSEQQQQQQQYHINRFTMTTTPTTTTTTTTTPDMSGPPRPISTAPAFQSIGYDEREKRFIISTCSSRIYLLIYKCT